MPVAGVLPVRQALRPGAAASAKALAALGLDLHILSGDRLAAVSRWPRRWGSIDGTEASSPRTRSRHREMKASGRRVLMVGDGLNDAPALAAAHVSLSPISAADITQAQADVVFLGEPLTPVLTRFDARRARALMEQNLWLAVLYNLSPCRSRLRVTSRR